MDEKIILKNIKSDRILKLIFFNLTKKVFLQIIKYNSQVQNKFNINIDDYK